MATVEPLQLLKAHALVPERARVQVQRDAVLVGEPGQELECLRARSLSLGDGLQLVDVDAPVHGGHLDQHLRVREDAGGGVVGEGVGVGRLEQVVEERLDRRGDHPRRAEALEADARGGVFRVLATGVAHDARILRVEGALVADGGLDLRRTSSHPHVLSCELGPVSRVWPDVDAVDPDCVHPVIESLNAGCVGAGVLVLTGHALCRTPHAPEGHRPRMLDGQVDRDDLGPLDRIGDVHARTGLARLGTEPTAHLIEGFPPAGRPHEEPIEHVEVLIGAVVDDERLALRVHDLALAEPPLEGGRVHRWVARGVAAERRGVVPHRDVGLGDGSPAAFPERPYSLRYCAQVRTARRVLLGARRDVGDGGEGVPVHRGHRQLLPTVVPACHALVAVERGEVGRRDLGNEAVGVVGPVALDERRHATAPPLRPASEGAQVPRDVGRRSFHGMPQPLRQLTGAVGPVGEEVCATAGHHRLLREARFVGADCHTPTITRSSGRKRTSHSPGTRSTFAPRRAASCKRPMFSGTTRSNL